MMRKQKAFSLIELMITLVIVVTLAAIAMPLYDEYVRNSRRLDAAMMLQTGAQWMERYRAERNGTYADAVLPVDFSQSPAGGTAAYNIALTVPVAGNAFTLTAAPTGVMLNDECGSLTIDNTGLRTADGGSTTADILKKCWGR
jgi:type IV pilus assembly protein PilE